MVDQTAVAQELGDRDRQADPPSHRLAVDSRTFALIASTYFDGPPYKATGDRVKWEGVTGLPSQSPGFESR